MRVGEAGLRRLPAWAGAGRGARRPRPRDAGAPGGVGRAGGGGAAGRWLPSRAAAASPCRSPGALRQRRPLCGFAEQRSCARRPRSRPGALPSGASLRSSSQLFSAPPLRSSSQVLPTPLPSGSPLWPSSLRPPKVLPQLLPSGRPSGPPLWPSSLRSLQVLPQALLAPLPSGPPPHITVFGSISLLMRFSQRDIEAALLTSFLQIELVGRPYASASEAPLPRTAGSRKGFGRGGGLAWLASNREPASLPVVRPLLSVFSGVRDQTLQESRVHRKRLAPGCLGRSGGPAASVTV